MTARALPHSDASIFASLKTIATGTSLAKPWQGEDTTLTSAVFDCFVRHANLYWFDVEQSFEYAEGVTTVRQFMEQLRRHEAALAPV